MTPGSLNGSFASRRYAATQAGTIGAGTIGLGSSSGNTPLDQINRDVTKVNLVTRDEETGFNVSIDPGAIREIGALARGDATTSVILQGGQALARDPLGVAKSVLAEIDAVKDHKADSGALDTLLGAANRVLVGDQRANEIEARTIATDPRFLDRSPDEIGALRLQDAIAGVRTRYGEAAAAAFAAQFETAAGRKILRDVGVLTAAYREKRGDPAAVRNEKAPPAQTDGSHPSEASRPGSLTVTGSAPTLGDRTVALLASAGRLINTLPASAREAASFGLSALLGGPVAAVGGYFIDKAVETGIQQSETAQEAFKTLGLLGVSALSSASYERNAQEARASGNYEEGTNLLTAAGTLLNMGVAKKLAALGAAGVTRGKAILPGAVREPQIGGGTGVPHDKAATDRVIVEDRNTGPYDPKAIRAALEEKYGADNVTSTTVPPAPRQRVKSDRAEGVEVITDANGGRAVRVAYNDPVTGEPNSAHIPYDVRGLPIFDSVAKFITRLDRSLSPNGQMRQATRDLPAAIRSGAVDKSQFTELQLEAIEAGSSKIPDWTWHHNAQSAPPSMQLIPDKLHKLVLHVGTVSLEKGR